MTVTELLLSPEAWISLGVLSLMEIVLGIDNIVFITILTGRLPREKQLPARRIGLAAALITRLMLLSCISWLMHLDEPLYPGVFEYSGKDVILFLGGLFLLYKATKEIYENVEHPETANHEAGDVVSAVPKAPKGTAIIIMQIMILDVVFSLDSVITAVGMAEHLVIMAT
ncbi:MAG: TerC family protein, partial [Proteobacteria bacterium]|nr:TerC family protein [Pseudomonadota bacterium]